MTDTFSIPYVDNGVAGTFDFTVTIEGTDLVAVDDVFSTSVDTAVTGNLITNTNDNNGIAESASDHDDRLTSGSIVTRPDFNLMLQFDASQDTTNNGIWENIYASSGFPGGIDYYFNTGVDDVNVRNLTRYDAGIDRAYGFNIPGTNDVSGGAEYTDSNGIATTPEDFGTGPNFGVSDNDVNLSRGSVSA